MLVHVINKCTNIQHDACRITVHKREMLND